MTDKIEFPQFGLLDGLQRQEAIKEFLENQGALPIECKELRRDDLTREQKKDIIRNILVRKILGS